MATPKKKFKKSAAKERSALAQYKSATAARKHTVKKAARKPRKRTAKPIGKHPVSPRGGRPCKACAELHSKRQHGSHAKGPRIAHSYKTRKEGVYAKTRKAPAKKRVARKARAK